MKTSAQDIVIELVRKSYPKKPTSTVRSLSAGYRMDPVYWEMTMACKEMFEIME